MRYLAILTILYLSDPTQPEQHQVEVDSPIKCAELVRQFITDENVRQIGAAGMSIECIAVRVANEVEASTNGAAK